MLAIPSSEFKASTIETANTDASKADYSEQFRNLKQEINSGRFEKVILSRTKKIANTQSAIQIFQKLNAAYSNTLNYIISNETIGTWIGATPESLFTASENQVTTMSLAGTKTEKDEWSSKEYEEQQLVTASIVNTFKKANCQKILELGPTTIKAGKIQHLHTKITATMNQESDWISILNELHPTPAVCGIPKQEALKFIPQLEKHNRKFYTGYIGIIKKDQKQFFVNLRCMELHKNEAKLYVGGGITAPSEENAEWEETERKAFTLANILA